MKLRKLLLSVGLVSLVSSAFAQTAGEIRLMHVMAKARRGETITVAGFGGSITQGTGASGSSYQYASLVADWWKAKFPDKVEFLNVGAGGTGSGAGVARAEAQMLGNIPDYVFIDFAANDLNGYGGYTKTMEGLIRKIMIRPNLPAVHLVYFGTDDYQTAKNYYQGLAQQYGIPEADVIASVKHDVEAGTLVNRRAVKDAEQNPDAFFNDEVHPSDFGHAYAAKIITDQLEAIYAKLPVSDAEIPAIPAIPAAVDSNVFTYSQCWNYNTLSPSIVGSVKKGDEDRKGGCGIGWTFNAVGDELSADLYGSEFGILLAWNRKDENGIAEMWVDNGEHVMIDGYKTPSQDAWTGTRPIYVPAAVGLPNGKHTLHIRLTDKKNPLAPAAGNFFEIMDILAAGATHDPLNNYTVVQSGRGAAVGIDRDDAELYSGDGSRIYPKTDKTASLVWRHDNLSQIQAEFFVPQGKTATPQISISKDGLEWTDIEYQASVAELGAGMSNKVSISISDSSGANFVRATWTNPDSDSRVELGTMVIY